MTDLPVNPLETFVVAIAAAADTPDLLRLQNVELPALPVTEIERAGLKERIHRRFAQLNRAALGAPTPRWN